MKLQITLKDKKGFTLIEIIVVVAIVISLFAFGILIDSKAFTRTSVISEQETLVSILQKARSRAMNNIEHTRHGVFVDEDKYVIFQSSYDEDDEDNEKIERNENFTITGLYQTEIIFDQISGIPNVTGEIKISDGVIEKTININEVGLIDW